MDLNRSSHINKTDEDIATEDLPNQTDKQSHQPPENGVLLVDLDDDLFLGADAQVFSTSGSVEAASASPGSSSLSTGFNYESSSESTGYPESHGLLTRTLDHMERHNSIESSVSDLSDFSRTSHDVSSLLNAMTVDPEEFLADLGFAESDMRIRIPDRFLESPSQAQGIDVELFRRSLEQDDLYGSSSQDSPVWSDPGSSRIPLRFIASHAEPISPVFSGGFSSIPLISEPEEAPEGSFDLMRHLRLNKPQHVTKGVFLEPVTEELEVSSVGSGTIRTKISRRLSNEEGTIIVREESLEQAANVESELFLNVPVIGSEQTGVDSNETNLTTEVEIVGNQSGIVVNVDAKEDTGVSFLESTVLSYSAKSSSEGVDSSNHSAGSFQYESSVGDYDNQDLGEETVTDISPVSAVPAHLRVASIVVQDSFELEEIANEEFSEKELSASTDQENSLVVKSSERRLMRENSGESSGFEEMLPDKESASPVSSSPILKTKEFPILSQVIVTDRRPLQALLDPEMLSLALEEKSPRSTFAQRRTKSLTKQRPIDEETYASWALSARPSVAKYVDESLGTSVNHDESSEETGSSFSADGAEEPVIEYLKSNLHSYASETNENCMRMSNIGFANLSVTVEPSKLEESNSFEKEGETQAGIFENKMQTNKASLSLPESSLHLQSEKPLGGEENISHSKLSKEEVIAHEGVCESKEDVSAMTYSCFPEQGHEASTHIEQDEESQTSLSEENESAGACAEVRQREESQKALRKIDSECQQHYLHEISVLEQSIEKYESHLSREGPLDGVRATNYTKHMLVRITEEVNAIHELRLLISSELERMRCLLSERRKMLLAGATSSPVCTGVTQKMADLLREQSSLSIGLSNISDELAIRKKASRRARIYAHIESAKKELKEERGKCMREFREEIKETLARELSERFSGEINLLRHEVRAKDAVIEQLMKNQEQRDLED